MYAEDHVLAELSIEDTRKGRVNWFTLPNDIPNTSCVSGFFYFSLFNISSRTSLHIWSQKIDVKDEYKDKVFYFVAFPSKKEQTLPMNKNYVITGLSVVLLVTVGYFIYIKQQSLADMNNKIPAGTSTLSEASTQTPQSIFDLVHDDVLLAQISNQDLSFLCKQVISYYPYYFNNHKVCSSDPKNPLPKPTSLEDHEETEIKAKKIEISEIISKIDTYDGFYDVVIRYWIGPVESDLSCTGRACSGYEVAVIKMNSTSLYPIALSNVGIFDLCDLKYSTERNNKSDMTDYTFVMNFNRSRQTERCFLGDTDVYPIRLKSTFKNHVLTDRYYEYKNTEGVVVTSKNEPSSSDVFVD